MARLAFAFDANKCTGCKVCAAACKDKNDLAAGRKFRKVYVMATGGWKLNDQGVYEHQKVGGYNVSISCMHCEKPACQPVCPVGAIGKRKEDGIVFIDQDLCIGCGSCVEACPYHAPSLDMSAAIEGTDVMGKTNKCDFCRDALAAGEQPACVSACVGRALDCGEYDDMVKKYGKEQVIQPLPDNKTRPSFVVKPHRYYAGKSGMVDTSLPEETQANEPA